MRLKKYILFITSFFMVFSLHSQELNLNELSDSVYVLNNQFKYDQSINLLNYYIGKEDNPDKKISLYIQKSYVYKRTFNYPLCLISLLNADKIVENQSVSEMSKMEVLYEKSLYYFDVQEYLTSEALSDSILYNYTEFLTDDIKGKLILQKGYLYSLNNQLIKAELLYDSAIQYFKKASPCDLPLLYVKKIELYSKLNQIDNMIAMYDKSIQVADSCEILKYKFFAAEVMKTEVNKAGKTEMYAYYNKQYTEYEKQYNQIDGNLKLQIAERKYEEEKRKLKTQELTYKNRISTLISITALILFIIIAFFLFLSRKSKKKLDKSYKEKQVLHQELEHRVKNNFQTISSLINMQKQFAGEDSKKELELIDSRIMAMAEMHSRFNHEEETIGVKEYLEQIINYQKELKDSSKNGIYNINIENIQVSKDVFLYLGIIVNELMTNFYKHSFPIDPTILLSLLFENNVIIVHYQTAGSESSTNSSQLGLTIIEGLITNYDGEMTLSHTPEKYSLTITLNHE